MGSCILGSIEFPMYEYPFYRLTQPGAVQELAVFRSACEPPYFRDVRFADFGFDPLAGKIYLTVNVARYSEAGGSSTTVAVMVISGLPQVTDLIPAGATGPQGPPGPAGSTQKAAEAGARPLQRSIPWRPRSSSLGDYSSRNTTISPSLMYL